LQRDLAAQSWRRPALSLALPRVRVSERAAIFAASMALYLVVAVRLTLASGFIVVDAWSRVGNAAYVIASRDPHLAAIGFVWNPLPSLVMLPLVAVRGLWPPLTTQGFAANIVSALFMAGAVVVVADIGRDLRLDRPLRLAFVALFALHPMIVLYGANGMSEAPFIFFLLLAVRFAIRWFERPSTVDLAILGLALAGAYLTRYEAVAAAAALVAIVGVRRLLLGSGPRRARILTTVADLTLGLTPFVTVFVGWALASWVITGSAFETFSSIYGNSSQVALSRPSIAATTGSGLQALGYFGSQLALLAPGIPLLAIAIVDLVAIGRGQGVTTVRRLTPTLILVGVLAFSAVAMITGASFGWLRFAIVVVPLAVVTAQLIARGADLAAATPELARPRALVARGFVPALLIASLVVAMPIALNGMSDPRYGREEQGQVAAIEGRDISGQDNVRVSAVASQVAAYIDGLGLPRGSVAVDVAIGFPIVLRSDDMRTFVITPDQDFQRAVADPAIFHVRYLLVSSGQGYAALDAVSRAHPGLYDDGAGIATLVRQFGDGNYAWRLYQVKG
jgi:hypothetical protein